MPLNSLVPEAIHHTGRPHVRPATFDDYEQIAALQEANGLTAKPRDEWLDLWLTNPAYGRFEDWPVAWVLEQQQGRVVGVVEAVPCLYKFQGVTYVAAIGRGWAVDIAYRGDAFQLFSRAMRQPNIDLFVTNTANTRTAALLTRRGWSRVPVGRWDQSAFWVTSYAQAARRCLAAKATPSVSALATSLFYLPSRFKDAATRRFRSPATGCELRWRPDFDEQFDQFWIDLQRQKQHLLLAQRDSQALRWHFRSAMRQNRVWILTACEDRQLIAYAIFERRWIQSLNLARVLLVDFQTLRNDRGLVDAMISFALDRCRQSQVEVVENMGCWLEAAHPLGNRPPFRRDLENWSYLYHARSASLAASLRNPQAWYPTQYDADACL